MISSEAKQKQPMTVADTSEAENIITEEVETKVESVGKENATTAYTGVTTLKQARQILSAEPFNISQNRMRNATMIFGIIEELGLEFPDLPR